jgi:hypothetical protein
MSKSIVIGMVILGAYIVMDALGLGAHASVIAGMPQSTVSYAIGPLYALLRLGAVIVSPILLLGATINLARQRFAQGRSRLESSRSK